MRAPSRALIAVLQRAPTEAALRTAREAAVAEAARRFDVVPALAGVLIDHGRLTMIPDSFLDAIFDGQGDRLWNHEIALMRAVQNSRRRHVALATHRERVAQQVERLGAHAVLLKGAALVDAGVWPDPWRRTMRDVDILVSGAGRCEAVQAALIETGYRELHYAETEVGPPSDHQLHALVRPGERASLELHRHVLVARYAHYRQHVVVPQPDRSGSSATSFDPMSLVDLARHVILHAQLQDEAYRRLVLPMTALLDVAFLVERDPTLASRIIRPGDPARVRKLLNFHLYSVARLRGHSISGRHPWFATRWAAAVQMADLPRMQLVIRTASLAPRAVFRDVESLIRGEGQGVRRRLADRLRRLRRRARQARGEASRSSMSRWWRKNRQLSGG